MPFHHQGLRWPLIPAAVIASAFPAATLEAQRLPVPPAAPEPPAATPTPLPEPVYEDEKLEKFYNTRAVVPHQYKETALEANRLVAQGRLAEAETIYRKILDAYPESLFALSNLAVVEFRLGKFGPAAAKLEKALKNAPEDAFSHSVLGICYYQMGKLDLAVKSLNRSISIDPGDARTRNFMGIVSSKKGWWRAAEAECKRAIELDPQLSDGYYNLATVYAHRPSPDYSLARDYYAKALKAGHTPRPDLEERIGFKTEPR